MSSRAPQPCAQRSQGRLAISSPHLHAASTLAGILSFITDKTAQFDAFELSPKEARPKDVGHTRVLCMSIHTFNILVAYGLTVLSEVIGVNNPA